MTPEHAATARRALAFVLTALVSLGVGLAAGRFSAPAVTQTKIEYRSLAVEDITRGFTFARVVNRVVYRNVVTTITDAGTTVADTSVEREGDTTTGASTETGHTVTDNSGTNMKTVTLRPSWRLGVQVGASLKAPGLVITGPLVLGVSVETRIAQTPFGVGLWGNTVGAGGVSLSGEF